MTDQHLLRAITDNPDDDLPRLAYADWCEENGNPLRSEFIRLGFEVAATGLESCPKPAQAAHMASSLPKHPAAFRCGKCDFCRPMKRLQELLDSKPPIPGLRPGFSCAASVEAPPGKSFSYDTLFKSTPGVFCYFRKGFVEEIRLPLNAWLTPGTREPIFGHIVVNSHPIKRVVACDIIPAEYNMRSHLGTIVRHAWVDMDTEQFLGTHSRLPSSIFCLLAGFDLLGTTGMAGKKHYRSQREAYDALSDVLLRMAHDPGMLSDPKRYAKPRHAVG